MADPTAEEIAALDSKHRRTATVRDKHGRWCIVLRAPTRPEYKMLRSMTHNPAQAPDAQEMCVRKLIVWPALDAAGVDALLDDWPGIPEACGQAILDLTGASGGADAK